MAGLLARSMPLHILSLFDALIHGDEEAGVHS